ncbi:hypothetical protein Asp14428_48820 [Actinoplanes sp. NBRC 14428]|nr:hypothetical protein Asp14428_48820 [Actinoplanes sp. NBRC 14428]
MTYASLLTISVYLWTFGRLPDVTFKKWVNRGAAALGYTSVAFGLVTGSVQVAQWLPDSKIVLSSKDNDIVPHCFVLRGSAPQREGMVLVEAHHSSANRYYFNRVVRGEGDDFTMTSNVGSDSSTGQVYTMEVFYLPAETAGFVLGLEGTGESGTDDGQAFASSLPPGAENIERRTVRRSDVPDLKRC